MNTYKHKTFHLSGKLTEEQINFFEEHGVLHFKNFINRETVNAFTSELGRIQKHLVSKNIAKVNGVPLKYGYDSAGNRIVQRLAFTSHFSTVLSDF